MLTGTCLCGTCTWTFDATPESVTACNCSACVRYGTLWIYGHKDRDVHLRGPVVSYRRTDMPKTHLTFDHCPTCGCVLAWTGLGPEREGAAVRRAANLRLVDDPAPWMDLPIDHFDGRDSFDDLPRDARRVRDMWF